MKIIITLLLMVLTSICYGEEPIGKACLNIPLRGLDTDNIEKTCKKGDIILLDKRHAPYLCNFAYAIMFYDRKDKYACVYLGESRGLREGTNY